MFNWSSSVHRNNKTTIECITVQFLITISVETAAIQGATLQAKKAALGLMCSKFIRHLGNQETIDLKCCSYVLIIILLLNRTWNNYEPAPESALMLCL